MLETSKVIGKIVEVNENTGWGVVVYDLTSMKFHLTSFRAPTYSRLPIIGEKVELVFNCKGDLICLYGVKEKNP